MTTSRWKNLQGIHKVRKCQGSYTCINTSCSFLVESGNANKSNWEHINQKRICFSCNQLATYKECPARKLIEFLPERKEYYIFHIRYYTCMTQDKPLRFNDFIIDCVKKYPHLPPKKLKHTIVGQLISEERHQSTDCCRKTNK